MVILSPTRQVIDELGACTIFRWVSAETIATPPLYSPLSYSDKVIKQKLSKCKIGGLRYSYEQSPRG